MAIWMEYISMIVVKMGSINSIRVQPDKDVKERGGNNGLQVAAYGERTTERMSIATWIVCGLLIVEYTTNSVAKFPFDEKTEKWINHGKAKAGQAPGIPKVMFVV